MKNHPRDGKELIGKVIIWFKDINKNDLALVGGKGTGLGELFNNGFHVPNGFCVSALVYEDFVVKNELQDKIKGFLWDLDVEDTEKLEKAANNIKKLILKAPMDEQIKQRIIGAYHEMKKGFVAVRSSATAEDLPTASFAGQQSTFLNVNGDGALLKAVQECWASLWEPRAIFYREKNNFDHMIVLISVVVQHMVQPDCAGVIFTANPVTNNREEILVEGSYGLGEMVVSGQITPDSFIIDKKTLEIKQKSIGTKSKQMVKAKDGSNEIKDVDQEMQEKQCISDEQVKKLAEIGKKIEKHFKFPQDCEWAIENDEIFMLQSRPITTLK